MIKTCICSHAKDKHTPTCYFCSCEVFRQKDYANYKNLYADFSEKEKVLFNRILPDGIPQDIDSITWLAKFNSSIDVAALYLSGEEKDDILTIAGIVKHLFSRKKLTDNTAERETKYFQILNQHGPNVQQEFKKYVGEVITEYPLRVVIAHSEDKQIKEGISRFKKVQIEGTRETERVKCAEYTDVILDAYPTHITAIYDPLEQHEKYEISLQQSKTNETFAIGPLPLPDLVDKLKTEYSKLVWTPRILDARLSVIIQAYAAVKKIEYKTEIEKQGFFWINGKLVASKIKYEATSKERIKECAKFLIELQQGYYSYSATARKRLAHTIKLAIAGPLGYARKQLGIINDKGFTPGLDLAGVSNTAKTLGIGAILLKVNRQNLDDDIIPARDIQTIPKLHDLLGEKTLFFVCDEVDFLTNNRNDEKAKNMIASLKNSIDKLRSKRLLGAEHNKILEPLYAIPILTHNSDPIIEEGFNKRFITWQFTDSDIKTEEQQERYNNIMHEKGNECLAWLGDFRTEFILKNPDLLNNTWSNIAKTILHKLYETAGIAYPQWLDEETTTDDKTITAKELDEIRRLDIAQIFLKECNDIWARHRYEYGTKEASFPLSARIDTLIQNNLWPNFYYHKEKGICITAGIIKVLKDNKVDRVSHIRIAELCGFKYGPVFLNGENKKAVYCTTDQLVRFLSPDITDDPTKDDNSKLKGEPTDPPAPAPAATVTEEIKEVSATSTNQTALQMQKGLPAEYQKIIMVDEQGNYRCRKHKDEVLLDRQSAMSHAKSVHMTESN